MAVAVSLLTSEAVYSGSQTRDTASFTLGANELGLIFILNARDGGAASPGTVTVSQTGLTWVEITNVTYHTIASATKRITAFRAMSASSNTGVASFTVTGTTQAIWDYAVIKCTGTDTSGTNGSGAIVQSVTNRVDANASNLTITLAALGDATNNAVVSAFGGSADHTGTPQTGYTELSDATSNNSDSFETQYKVPGTTTPAISGYFNEAIAGIAVEVKMAAAGGGTANPWNYYAQC